MPATASPTRATPRRATKTPTLVPTTEPDHDPSPAPAAPTDVPSPESPEPTELNLIASLFSDTLALEDLARAHGLSLRALIAWAERRDIASLRRSMRELADDRADLIVSRARTAAAHKLKSFVESAKADETTRKACVDLLRLRSAQSAAIPEPNSTDAPPGSDEGEAGTDTDDDLLAKLDRLARITHAPRLTADDDRDLDTPPSGAD
jgi:hypothetical protein